MGDYVERQSVLEIVKRTSGDYATAFSEISRLKSANVREDVHGKWIVVEYEYLNCSVCGKAMYTGCSSSKETMILKDHWKNFCPNCGAMMREKK